VRSTAAIHPNTLDRQFTADAPNRKWAADFTYIRTAEGWLYVAGVLAFMPALALVLALNVWVEKDELLIYIGSPDSWSYRGRGFNTQMQTKLGRVRLKFTPVAWAKEFRQELELATNSILLSGKTVDGHALKLRVWVDAMQPVVHLEGRSESLIEAAVAVEFPTGLAMAPHHEGQTYGPLVREGRIDGDSLEWWERSPAIDEGRDEYIRRFNLKELADLLQIIFRQAHVILAHLY
jgi:hypothetical protein